MAKNIAPVPAAGGAPKPALKVENASGAPSKNTKLMPKKGAQSADPSRQPVAPARQYAPKERNGAAYGVAVAFEAHVAPEAGATLANGRIFPQAVKRSAPNFRAGMGDHN